MSDRPPALLPCPWCGSGDLDIGKSKMFGGLMIECEGCQMVVLPSTVSRGEAIAAWNVVWSSNRFIGAPVGIELT